MSIKKINELPIANGLTNDDIFLIMDDPSGSAVTKKVSLSTLAAAIGGGSNGSNSTSPILVYDNGHTYSTNDLVIYNNDIWFCYDGSNLSGGYAPPTRPSNWKKIATGSLSGTGDVVFEGSTISTANNDQDLIITTNNNGNILIGADRNMIFDMNAFSGKGILLQDSQEDGYDDTNTPSTLKVGSIYHDTGRMVISSDGTIVDESGQSIGPVYGGVWVTNGEDTGLSIPPPTSPMSINEPISIKNNGSEWSFKKDTIDLHNGGVQNAQIFQFNDNSRQSVITGPTPDENTNAQRLIIQGQKGNGTGEGGDVYIWGGDSDINGGDIKIYAGDADGVASGNGGYVNIDGGKGAGNSSGGNVDITGGYSVDGQAGDVNIVGGPTSSGVAGNVVIKTNNNNHNWTFGPNGSITLPEGSILSEINNTVSIMPPTAAVGQSLAIRPTQATWGMSTSNYIEYGNPITISVTLQNWAYFGTVNYTISGTGVTPQSLGRALTGKLTFVSTSAPDTETITWTIPANSNITEFTLTLTSVDGTRPGPDVADANLYPALYYNFEESNGMPTGQFITVTNNAMVNSEHSHVHLLSGDPATVDLYLGDDDQYVKIQKNGGDVVVGTKSETVVNTLTLITSGTGYAVTPNDVAALGGSGTGMRVNYANNGGSVIVVVINTLGTGYQHGDILTLSGGNQNCTFRYSNHNNTYNNWTFGTNGKLTLPIDGDIVDSNGTSVLGGSGSTTVVDLSYSSTINTDASTGDIFDISLTGNTTLANPTNPVNGKTLRWRITQDSTGNRTVSLGNKFNIPSSATSPLPWSTESNKMNILAATYHAGRDKWDIIAFIPGY